MPEEGGSGSWWQCPGLLLNLRMLPQGHQGALGPMVPIRAVLGLPGTGLPQSPYGSVIGWEQPVEAWGQSKGGWI